LSTAWLSLYQVYKLWIFSESEYFCLNFLFCFYFNTEKPKNTTTPTQISHTTRIFLPIIQEIIMKTKYKLDENRTTTEKNDHDLRLGAQFSKNFNQFRKKNFDLNPPCFKQICLFFSLSLFLLFLHHCFVSNKWYLTATPNKQSHKFFQETRKKPHRS